MKVCTKCNVEKPNEEYYFSKGRYTSSCKDCQRECAKLYNKTDAGKARIEKYLHTDKGRAKMYRKQQNRIEREQARWTVRSAVRSGKILPAKQLLCSDCNSQASDYHHPSYDFDKRLDVIPLCKKCHRIRHGTESLPPHSLDVPEVPKIP